MAQPASISSLTEEKRKHIVTSDYSDYYFLKRNSDYSDYSDYKKVTVVSKVDTKRQHKTLTEKEALAKASYIAAKLNNPTRLKFYLKCVWNLTEPYLDKLLEISLTKNDPKRYFSASASREMKNNN